MDLLPPETVARPRNRTAPDRAIDIVDAEFEVVPAGIRRPSSPHFNDNAKSGSRSSGPASGRLLGLLIRGAIRTVNAIEGALQSTSPRVFAGVVTVTFACVFLGAAAFAGIASMSTPATRPAGLHVAGVSTSLDTRDGMEVLSIYGRIVNSTSRPQVMPRVLVDVMVGEKRILTSSLTPQGTSIGSGEASYFSARLPHSGGKKPEVRVSLAPMDAPGN